MTTKDLEQLIGEQVPAKRELQLVGDRLFHRDGDNWTEYPPYPRGHNDV